MLGLLHLGHGIFLERQHVGATMRRWPAPVSPTDRLSGGVEVVRVCHQTVDDDDVHRDDDDSYPRFRW